MTLGRFLLLVTTTLMLTSLGCSGVDYDISEVASDEYLGLTEHHHEGEEHDGECDCEEHSEDGDEHDTGTVGATFTNPYPRYDQSFLCVNREADPELLGDPESSGLHVHGAGERNHGTGWFFNQPWAATFIWGKMVRDSIILLLLAAAVLFVSGRVTGGKGGR